MLRNLELSDYQLWMCKKIKEKLSEEHLIKSASHFPNEYEEKEVISIALSEMLMKLDFLDRRTK